MNLTTLDIIAITAALAAILMVGSRHLQLNLGFYSFQTMMIAVATAVRASQVAEPHLYIVAMAIAGIKAVGIPIFLGRIIKRIDVQNDSGTMLPAPLAMHLSIGLFGISYFLAAQLPAQTGIGQTTCSAAAAFSLLLTGLLLMLTRKVALSQIVGFLTMENGIYLFALTQTVGMPMMVETGIFLDVLVAVMITGLLMFKIKTSFEHIDVTQMTELKD